MKIIKNIIFVFFINIFIFVRFVYTDDDDVILNIGDDTSDYVFFKMSQSFGALSLKTYIPDVTLSIFKVMDCASTIWIRQDEEELLTLVRTYSLYKLQKLLYLYVVGEEDGYTRFFEKKDYDWVEISEMEFDLKLLALRRQRMFDLSNVYDFDTFHRQVVYLHGLPASIYIPYPRYDVITVVDDFDTIWEGNTIFDKCTCIILHGYQGLYKLMHLHLKINGGHDEIFYRKSSSEWIECTKEYFYYLLNEYDLEEDNGMT